MTNEQKRTHVVVVADLQQQLQHLKLPPIMFIDQLLLTEL
jgi:hypothetical protein